MVCRDDHVVNGRRANLKESVSEGHTLFHSAPRKKRWSLTWFHFFTWWCFSKLPLVLKWTT